MPPETSDREIFADVSGKKGQEKKGKGVKIGNKRRKIVKGTVKHLKWKYGEVGKITKKGEYRPCFFFFSFHF